MIAEQQKCLDAAMLADLLAGRMPTHRFAQAVEHIESCERCMRAAEDHSHHFKLTCSIDTSDSSSELKFEGEPECSAVVGNLLVQPTNATWGKSNSSMGTSLPRETLGPYRLIGSLGLGGMGTVYLAEHQRLKRQVALKLLPRDKLARTGWLDRFNREMTAIAALEHPHVVRALDAGDEDQWHYLVMEYLDGLDLNRVAKRIPDISVGTACEIIRQAALGLGAIHNEAMIHRDIKPSNIFLTRAGVVKLLDLGLVLDGESPLLADERLTTVGHLMGTLPFMAREQLNDARSVDWRTDIYSLGATLYKLLSGRPPYGSSENLASTIQAISTTEAVSIASRRSDLPAELVAIVDRMLSSDIAKRPQSANDVAKLLEPFCDAAGPKELIRSAIQCTVENEVTETNVSPLILPVANKPPRYRWPMLIAASLIPFAFVAGILATIVTDNGTLVIETDEPNASLKIVHADKVIDRLEVVQSQPSTLTLRSGKYVVEVTGVDSDRLEVKNNQVVMSRGERQVVKITRKDPVSLAESVKQTTENLRPTLTGLAVPAKTFQDKSLEEWTGILMRERSGESLAQAMEAVSSLVDTPNEKASAAKQFLQASRRLGGDSTVERSPTMRSTTSYPGGGGASSNSGGGGRGGRGPQPAGGRGGGAQPGSTTVLIPELPEPYTPTEFLMSALEKHFPKLYSGAPESGLEAIAEEFENGTPQSKTACLCLLSPFVAYKRGAKEQLLFDEMNNRKESQSLLQRLDGFIASTLNDVWMQTTTREKGYRLRITINKSLGRNLKQDEQLVTWAKGKLELAKKRVAGESNILDALSVVASYRVLEATDLDLSSLMIGLLPATNGVKASELDSAIEELCRRDPVACAQTFEAYLKSSTSPLFYDNPDARAKILLSNYALHHARPIDAILGIINRGYTSKHFTVFFQRLLVRLVLETDLANDPEADSKLAYAAHAFSIVEIPDDSVQKVFSTFLERLSIGDTSLDGFPVTESWPSEEAKKFDENARKNSWTRSRLNLHFAELTPKYPAVSMPAIAKEWRTGNKKKIPIFFDFLSAITRLTAEDKRSYAIIGKEQPNLIRFLQSDAGNQAILELASACDELIGKMLEASDTGEHEVPGFPAYSQFQSMIGFRIAIHKYLNQEPKENKTIANALRYIVSKGLEIHHCAIAEAIAELDGYAYFTNDWLLRFAQSYGGDLDAGQARFVNGVIASRPAEARLFFVNYLEKLSQSNDGNELYDRFEVWVRYFELRKQTGVAGVWDSIVQNLLESPDCRERTLAAVKKIAAMSRLINGIERKRLPGDSLPTQMRSVYEFPPNAGQFGRALESLLMQK